MRRTPAEPKDSTAASLLWGGLAVLAIAVAAALPLLWSRRYYFVDDTQNQYFGQWYHMGAELRAGRWPLLDPHTWMAGNTAVEGQWALWNPLLLGVSLAASYATSALVFVTVTKIAMLVVAGTGAFLLLRSYQVGPGLAFAGAVAVPLNGFTLYMDAPSWALGLLVWALLPHVWWSLRRAVAGRTPVLPMVFAYLLVTVGYVHGTIMLCLLLGGFLVQALVRRDRRAFLVALAVGVFSGLVALAVYLPGVLSADVTWRSSDAITNDDWMAADLAGLVGSSVPTALPGVDGFWGAAYAPAPILYIAWFLPVVLFASWGRVKQLLPEVTEALVLTVGAGALILGPSQIGPLRFPVRLMPYVALGVTVLVVVLLARARRSGVRLGQLVAAEACVLVALFFVWSEVPVSWRIQALSGLLVGAGVAAAWWLLRYRGLRTSPVAVALPALLAVLSVGLVGVQHLARPDSPFPAAQQLPALVADYQSQLSVAVNDAIVVGDTTTSPGGDALWDETLRGNGWYVNGRSVQNTYSPTGHAAFSAVSCRNTWGDVCPQMLEGLFRAQPTTGLLLVDQLSLDTIQMIKSSYQTDVWSAPPAGWRLAEDGTYTATWVRERPVGPAGGAVWTTGGTVVREVSRAADRVVLRVEEVPAEGGRVALSRLAWPGYRVSGGSVAEPVDGYLLAVDVPAGSAGQDVEITFRPPGWAVEVGALVAAGLLAVLAGVLHLLLRRRRPAPRRRSERQAAARPASGRWAQYRLVVAFAVAGVFNSLVHAAIFSGLVLAVPGITGAVAVVIAWVASIPVAYVVQSRFVWHQPMSGAGLLRLAVSYLPGVAVSTGLAAALGALGAGPAWQEVVGLVAAAVVSFVLQRFWVYKPRGAPPLSEQPLPDPRTPSVPRESLHEQH